MLSTLPFRFASPTTPLKRTNLLLSSTACGLSSPPPSSKMNTSTTMTSAETSPAAVNSDSGEVSGEERRLVQYVVLRRDLIDTWPLGSVVTQGCHAAVAAVWAHLDHPDTQAYLAPQAIDEMHKVTLEVKGEAQLKSLAEKLEDAGVRHKLWIEQPENIATCVATAPCQKSQVASLFKKLKLCK